MKAVYDKLFFVLALIVLAGSVAYFFFIAKGNFVVREKAAILTQPPSGSAYETVPAPQFERTEVSWPAPEPQDAEGNWLFDVFTPPRIYWDPVGQRLVSEPWQPAPQAPPFALELVSIDQELFRVQLEAYFAGQSGRPEDTIIQFINTQKDVSFRGTKGTTFEEHQIRVDDFEAKREFNPDGSVITVATAVLTDLTNGEQFTRNASQKLYVPDTFTITLRSTPPLPVETFTWKAVGDKQQVGDATFVLDAFDLEAETVTVTKTAPNLPEPETEVLTITTASPAPTPGGPVPLTPQAGGQGGSGTVPALPGGNFEDLFR